MWSLRDSADTQGQCSIAHSGRPVVDVTSSVGGPEPKSTRGRKQTQPSRHAVAQRTTLDIFDLAGGVSVAPLQ